MTGNASAFLDSNIEYNRYLISRCENATLRELVEFAWNKAVRYWNLLVRIPGYTSRPYGDIVGCIELWSGATATRQPKRNERCSFALSTS